MLQRDGPWLSSPHTYKNTVDSSLAAAPFNCSCLSFPKLELLSCFEKVPQFSLLKCIFISLCLPFPDVIPFLFSVGFFEWLYSIQFIKFLANLFPAQSLGVWRETQPLH